jgi:outer membrane receptor protein involved in Fe transport
MVWVAAVQGAEIPRRTELAGPGRARDLAPVGALAQAADQAPAGPKTAPPEAKTEDLEEVRVTADRNQNRPTTGATGLETPARDVPFSIQTIPLAVLREQDPVNLQDALRNVSGINSSTRANYGFLDNFYIRGFQAEVLRDGITEAITPINTERSGIFRGFVDIGRIEVLKGPAGALYGLQASGDNAGAGFINLVTRPFPAKAEAELTVTYGSYGRRLGQLNLGGPLEASGRLKYRLDLGFEARDGFRDQGITRLEVLPKLQWQVADTHTLTFDFDFRRIDAEPDIPSVPFLPGPNGAIFAGARERLFRTPFSRANQDIYRAGLVYNWQIAPNAAFANRFYYTRRTFDLIRNATDVIAYAVTPSGQFPSGIALARRLREQFDTDEAYFNRSEFTLEGRLLGMDHRLLTGIEFSRIAGNTLRYQSGFIGSTDQSNNALDPRVGNAVCAETARNIDTRRVPCVDFFNPVFTEARVARVQANVNEDRFSVNETFAAFLQDQITFSEQWKALVGVRFDNFREFQLRRAEGSNPQRSYDRTVARLNPRVGLVFQPDRNNAIYLSYASSFSSNGSAVVNNQLTALPVPFLYQFEIGYKASFFDDRLNLTASLFQINRENVVSRLDVNNNPTDPVDQRTQGVELDLIARPSSDWTFNLNYAYLDALTLRGVPLNLDANLGVLAPARTGAPITGVPRHSLNLWTTYSPARQWTLGLGINYQDQRFANQDGTGVLPAFVTLDALVAFRPTESTELQLNLRNLADADYYVGGGRGAAQPGLPFSAFGTVRYSF